MAVLSASRGFGIWRRVGDPGPWQGRDGMVNRQEAQMSPSRLQVLCWLGFLIRKVTYCRVNEVTGPSAQSPTQAPSESAPESRLLPTPPPAPPRPQEGSVGLTQGIGVTFGLSEV